MGDATPPRWQIAVLLVFLVAVSLVGTLYSSPRSGELQSRTTSLPTCAELRPSSGTEPPGGGARYVSENIQVPAAGSGWGPLTQVTFQGVQFRLWPEFASPEQVYLQGTGTEPNGIDLAFVVFSHNSTVGGNPPPTDASVRTWFSPDGVFGVIWLSSNPSAVEVELRVSDPLVEYAYENVTLSPITRSSDGVSESMDFDGVCFTLQVVDGISPGGPTLDASALEPNGTLVELGMSDGLLVACAIVGNTPGEALGNATCLESGTSDHSVALLWDGSFTVTLMVRST